MPSRTQLPARPEGRVIARTLPSRLAVALLVAVPALLLPAAGALHAQETPSAADSVTALLASTVTLVGVVRDTSGNPLSGAEVRAGATQYALTDAGGRFEVRGVEPDTIQLLVRRIGYQPADVYLEATAGTRVELAVKLVPLAMELGTIVVEGKRMSTRLMTNGFYDRQRTGFGKLLGPEELESTSASLSGLLHMVPSVLLERGRGGVAVAYGRSGTSYCPLNVFVDGVPIRFASELGLDQLVNRDHILAVEVYPRATTVPSSLAGRSATSSLVGGALPSPGAGISMDRHSDCGALVIWTKPFEERGERRVR